MKFKVVITEGEDGWYVVEVPALPGCISQGKTIEEALENIKEAIELYLEPDVQELNKETREFESAIKEIESGNYITHEELAKELSSVYKK